MSGPCRSLQPLPQPLLALPLQPLAGASPPVRPAAQAARCRPWQRQAPLPYRAGMLCRVAAAHSSEWGRHAVPDAPRPAFLAALCCSVWVDHTKSKPIATKVGSTWGGAASVEGAWANCSWALHRLHAYGTCGLAVPECPGVQHASGTPRKLPAPFPPAAYQLPVPPTPLSPRQLTNFVLTGTLDGKVDEGGERRVGFGLGWIPFELERSTVRRMHHCMECRVPRCKQRRALRTRRAR